MQQFIFNKISLPLFMWNVSSTNLDSTSSVFQAHIFRQFSHITNFGYAVVGCKRVHYLVSSKLYGQIKISIRT